VSAAAVSAVTTAVTTVTGVTGVTSAPECSHVCGPKKSGRSNVSIRRRVIRVIRVIGKGRIFRPPPGPIDNRRVVARHIDNLRIDRLDIDSLTFDNYLLFVAGLEIA
jgi:hypothetical protein